ncbi:MAG TPA: PQQ-binding-like beta-propeller repeat protein [Blastocatellia bacterium]|nr:PQQ-binding-like beta-propeller repeat protein [Blastocatellia bacterium]
MRKTDCKRLGLALVFATVIVATGASRPAGASPQTNQQTIEHTDVQVPSYSMKFGAFVAKFDPGGSFTLEGQGWPQLAGNWKSKGDEIELTLTTPGGPKGCEGPGRYRIRLDGNHLSFDLISDECTPRKMIIDHSTWAPTAEPKVIPPRRIVLTAGARAPSKTNGARPDPKTPNTANIPSGNWPSFRGQQASGIAERQNLPDRWDPKTGENILWRTPIPGLAHSSPVVWGNTIFVTSAVSSDPKATFRPGLYGDGDASQDRSQHRWMLYALDKRTGKIVWERVAHQGVPVDKRHIKSTYANSTPATDGRIVVAWFGSQGVYAYDVGGRLLWKVDLGRLDLGAYDIPTYEWGPASSPIIWNNLVILQCDTQNDSFLLALDADTGKTVWKTDREELPSWGTPTVAATSTGPILVANASNYIRGYDPRTGKELWRLGKSSKITAPTPVFSDDMFAVVSGRGPERPIFVVKAGARGDLTLPEGKSNSEAIVWSRTGRGSYMPTPLIYDGILYVLGNNGLFDAYNLRTGEEVYRQRLPVVGSGFSASPVASDGKIYLSNEDGEMLVIAAGQKFAHIATNSMGEMLMATPALSDGVMYVRSSASLFAVGRKH